MITLIVAIAVGCGSFAALHFAADWGWTGSVFVGLAGFVVVFMGVTKLFLQKRVEREKEAVQKILADGNKKLHQKMQRWQMRPPGSMQARQNEIFADTAVFVKEALVQSESLRKYRPWMLMMDRQIATMQLQLGWRIKDFRTVDRLMPKAFFLDPTMSAIKMARLYMLDKSVEEIAKVYEKAVRRLRYNENVLLAATMSWIQVKRDDAAGAFKTLTEALKKSDNETLKRNHELLMNNRVAHFSNSGVGDMWYSLYLEEPKMRTPRQRSVYR